MKEEAQREFRSNTSRGMKSLAASAVVIALLYIAPQAAGINLSELVGGAGAVAALRIALGVLVLVGLALFLRGLLNASTLTGETRAQGLRNLVNSPLFESEIVGMALLLLGGIALIVLVIASIVG